jgi:hypothetical protein
MIDELNNGIEIGIDTIGVLDTSGKKVYISFDTLDSIMYTIKFENKLKEMTEDWEKRNDDT